MPEEAKPPAVLLRGVSLRYGAVTALDNVSTSIAAGERVAIVGPSGSGKTSLLRVISGALASEGLAEIRGRLGIVYQDVKLLPWMTVWDNLHLGSSLGRATDVEARSWIEAAGLIARVSAYPYELSGGQKQRAAIIRALVQSPDIILLDEPFSALDFVAKKKLRTLMADIGKSRLITSITVTHDLQDAVEMAWRILVLREGAIVADIDLTGKRKDERLEVREVIEGLY